MSEFGINILLTTDLSEDARNAIIYALSMFGDEPRRFFFLHASQSTKTNPELLISLDDILEENSQRAMEIELQQFKLFPVHHQSDFEVLNYREKIEAILPKVIFDRQIHLVVMSIDNKFMRPQLLSSLSEISCPLLLIPANSEFRRPKQIILASDLKKITHHNKISPVLSYSKKFDAHLSLLNLSISENDNIDKEFIKNWQYKNHFNKVQFDFKHLRGDRLVEEIAQLSNYVKADLIALISGHYPLLKQNLHKNITKDLSSKTKVPLLVI